ncbi:hypothetical protein VP01_3387g4 [Puccinia sorghi]|uniref:Uncharacterized protein n=1 Tax=Puccinia sorghi TaxID=27349 RepID=A0A0L6UXL7_9BASI|nr:hypothetical protein VP01_3387g4 [Puccinia sorghi]
MKTAPANHSNGQLQKINIPEANEGILLLDSGSTINVSGSSAFFTAKRLLAAPLLISMAISEYVSSINSTCSLRNPNTTGTMVIEDI